MSNTEQKNVLITITEKYDEIFKAEKKVADFILKNPEVAVNANVSELANYSGVSDATVIRLCKHLGYSGYYQMKICLSRDMGSRDSGRKKKNQSKMLLWNLIFGLWGRQSQRSEHWLRIRRSGMW